ncbi:MAG: hypothetical protein LBJ12_09625 [Oscillospiraceae bacterium]|jgi:hypothetical protein|nr:hypothetical protein [Oscillospiraceae bacterium]
MLSAPLTAFGYGLHLVRLIALQHCLDNEVVEDIGVERYAEDIAYDSDDFSVL